MPISISIVVRARAGYPDGVPQNNYLPIPVLLSRRLGCAEVAIVAEELMHRPGLDNADVGAEIMRFTRRVARPRRHRTGASQAGHLWLAAEPPRDTEDAE